MLSGRPNIRLGSKAVRTNRGTRREQGFTLLEVLVAILVVALGLLGLAKMQALAISNTQISSSRSLIALQASSLAAAMQGNTGYWAAGVAPAVFSTAGTTVTDASGVLNQTVTTCVATSGSAPSSPVCTPAQLAAYDVQAWAANMNALFPGYGANFACNNVAGAPVTCTITITWAEKYVALNRTTATGTAASGGQQTATQSYTLYVSP
ncbi:MAG: Type IV fimbrial biogenesis protein PilV [Burkholderiaceae bacterium]|jgi:type IV pilus assembly protein PilV|nr:MAG: Type IV fimbrial biogenesis protein PilV [Burkholderiaceae bacterium]